MENNSYKQLYEEIKNALQLRDAQILQLETRLSQVEHQMPKTPQEASKLALKFMYLSKRGK